MKLNLYSVSDKYIKYLMQFDNRIYDTKTIIRIHEGGRLYGTLRISNMIPVPITELEPYIQLFGAKQVCSLKLYATQRLHKFYI